MKMKMKKINKFFDKLRIKREILVAKGIISEIMDEVNWNEEYLTLENRNKVSELLALINLCEASIAEK